MVFDQVLSTKVYEALQALRTALVNEAGGDLMPYHIMGSVIYFYDFLIFTKFILAALSNYLSLQ